MALLLDTIDQELRKRYLNILNDKHLDTEIMGNSFAVYSVEDSEDIWLYATMDSGRRMVMNPALNVRMGNIPIMEGAAERGMEFNVIVDNLLNDQIQWEDVQECSIRPKDVMGKTFYSCIFDFLEQYCRKHSTSRAANYSYTFSTERKLPVPTVLSAFAEYARVRSDAMRIYTNLLTLAHNGDQEFLRKCAMLFVQMRTARKSDIPALVAHMQNVEEEKKSLIEKILEKERKEKEKELSYNDVVKGDITDLGTSDDDEEEETEQVDLSNFDDID